MQEVAEKIRHEIHFRGVIPFSAFMEQALYCPVYGFYEKEGDIIGRHGDFYTSPSVGPLFGQLLAWQFAEWLTQIAKAGKPIAPLHIVEAGAHDGTLAYDVLAWLEKHRPELFQGVEYILAEPSPARRLRQQQKLKSFGAKVSWIDRLQPAGKTHPRVRGVIFSNELLDAMPVHRLGWDAKDRRWFEWGVGWKDGGFAWARMTELSPGAAEALPEVPGELRQILPDGFTTEVSPPATDWWRDAADSLEAGNLIAIDYGVEQEEFFAPERSHGTLRGYRQHYPVADILTDPGDQDITAHVNFSVLKRAGEARGLSSEPTKTQAQFLTGIFAEVCKTAGKPPNWTPEEVRQFQRLTHPEHLGRAFRVLVQTRDH